MCDVPVVGRGAGESAAIGLVSGGKAFVNMKPALRHTTTSAFKGPKGAALRKEGGRSKI